MFQLNDQQLDVLGELYQNIQCMTFAQFIEAVQAGRISIQQPAMHHAYQTVHTNNTREIIMERGHRRFG